MQHIARVVANLVPSEGGVLVIRDVELAARMERAGSTVAVRTEAQAVKAAKTFPQIQPVVDDGLVPQVAPGSASAVVAVECLADEVDRAAVALAWAELLAGGGRLLVVERVKQSAVSRGLRRLGRGPRVEPLTPQTMCAALLNAGLRQVGQVWPAGRPARVITVGTRL